jgi:hypothetical protein
MFGDMLLAGKRPVAAPGALLLDGLTVQPVIAVGFQKLRTSYSGPCVRLRRDSDNVEQDFGFVGNTLDSTSISSFAGTAGLRVTKLYGQSAGGFDFVQTNAGTQPVFGLTDFNGGADLITGGGQNCRMIARGVRGLNGSKVQVCALYRPGGADSDGGYGFTAGPPGGPSPIYDNPSIFGIDRTAGLVRGVISAPNSIGANSSFAKDGGGAYINSVLSIVADGTNFYSRMNRSLTMTSAYNASAVTFPATGDYGFGAGLDEGGPFFAAWSTLIVSDTPNTADLTAIENALRTFGGTP